MRKLLAIIFILFSFLILKPLSSHAQEEGATVFVTFDKVSYAAQEQIALTVHVKNFTNLYGFQIDLEETFDDFTFANPVSPYEIESNAIFYGDPVLVNGETDDVQSIMVTRQESETIGYDFSTKTALATIFLVAMRDIANPYDLFTISDDLNDLLYGDANIIIKLSNPEGMPIAYTYAVVLPDPIITLNPGVDTVYVGENHIDQGIDVDYEGPYDIEIENGVNQHVAGSYLIIYHVILADKTIDISRHVHILTHPKEVRFELNTTLTTVKVGSTFVDPGCKVYVDDVLQSSCEVLFDNVNTALKGIYTIEYGITLDNITYKMKRYVFVMDQDLKLDMPYKKEEDIVL